MWPWILSRRPTADTPCKMPDDSANAAETLFDPTDSTAFRRVLGSYPTGVCAIAAVGLDGLPVAMIVGSFTSVSLCPPLVAFLPAKASTSWPRIRETGRFCVSTLAADQQDLCRHMSSTSPNRFASLAQGRSRLGSPILSDALPWMDCQLEAAHDAGDHDIAVARMQALGAGRAADPPIFFRGSYGTFQSTS
jgi:3-hydroxy-9,10-secoandrosta-1,3,5(10)-triene-9,17-dione monooxygenase reductase component